MNGRVETCSPFIILYSRTVEEGILMIILGIILLILGFVFGISILWTIGIILIVAGAVLTILGATGRAVGGRKTWY